MSDTNNNNNKIKPLPSRTRFRHKLEQYYDVISYLASHTEENSTQNTMSKIISRALMGNTDQANQVMIPLIKVGLITFTANTKKTYHHGQRKIRGQTKGWFSVTSKGILFLHLCEKLAMILPEALLIPSSRCSYGHNHNYYTNNNNNKSVAAAQ